jgi:hypothetical protein
MLITIMLFFPHGLLPGVVGAIRSLWRRLGASRGGS